MPGKINLTRRKFGNVKTEVDGVVFDSKREANRWSELVLMQRAGLITNLQRQVRFELLVNGVKIGRYTADFSYWDLVGRAPKNCGGMVVEDAKAKSPRARSRDYVLRKKLMKAIHGITIKEV